MRFVDTNVLIYAVSALSEDVDKRRLAIDLIQEDDLAMSVQVLQEFYFQATHPNRRAALTHTQAMAFVVSVDHIPVHPMTVAIFNSAVSISQRYGLAYWDGAILASARAAKCDAVYSEDMSGKQDYGGIRVINPFAVS